jgi:hypothetical protein
MKNSSFYNEFIRAIEDLYSNITLRILQKRMDTYQSTPQIDNLPGRSGDITKSLFQYIDDISSQAQKTVTESQTQDNSLSSQTPHSHTASQSELVTPKIVNKENANGLSKFFKASHHGDDFHPGVAEKLEHAIWEHINAAIRHAKRGETAVAKMHADIANNAYKELAHYVSNEAYRKFGLEIEDQLDVLSNDK